MRPFLLLAALAATALAACAPGRSTLRLVTTTSVENSGLLEAILPVFERETGAEVEAVAVGSGQAFQIGRRGDASLLMTHEPLGERMLFDEGLVRYYRKVMFNRFVIAGPPADPAGIAQAAGAVDAMTRIARSGALFASRGDESGTHVREQLLWDRAHVRPEGARLIETGQGMSATLRVAAERGAYVLTDEATLARLQGAVSLRALSAGDPILLNTYAVIILKAARRDPGGHADQLARWLAEGAGRDAIDAFRIDGRQVFFSWPVNADASQPEAMPAGRQP